MPDVIGCIHLNLEAIRIEELKRFLRIAALELQIELLQFRARLVGVEARNAEVIMIHRGSLIIALLNAKDGVVPGTQNVCRRRLLLKRHPEELLIEFGSAVKVGNLYRNVDYGDRSEEHTS